MRDFELPGCFDSGEEFMDYVYATYPSRDTHVECQGHGHWMADLGMGLGVAYALYDEESRLVSWFNEEDEEIA